MLQQIAVAMKKKNIVCQGSSEPKRMKFKVKKRSITQAIPARQFWHAATYGKSSRLQQPLNQYGINHGHSNTKDPFSNAHKYFSSYRRSTVH